MSIILPNDYLPSENEEYMSPYQICYFKERLLNMKNDLLSKDLDVKEVFSDIRMSDMFETASQESDIHMELSDKQLKYKSINDVVESLKRIDELSYGYCEILGIEIGVKRLMINPTTKYSVEAQEDMDKD